MGGIYTRHLEGVRWDVNTTTHPTVEPITLAQAKSHLRYTGTDAAEEAYISRLVVASRLTIEEQTNRTFHQTARTLTLDRWPRHVTVLLPYPPIISVASVKYYDPDGAQQTVSSGNYRVITTAEPGRVEPISTFAWPTIQTRAAAIEVAYLSGYITTAGGPADMAAARAQSIEAVYLLLEHWYRNRAATADKMQYPIGLGVDALTCNDRCNEHLMEEMR